MGPPTRGSLQAMKRVDLQRLCKDYGVKANLKTDALIDSLLDASRSARDSSAEAQGSGSTRRPTTRLRSNRTRSRRTPSSNTDVETAESDYAREGQARVSRGYESEPMMAASGRSKRGTQPQLRLAVGAPDVANGRDATRSVSLPRGRTRRSYRKTVVDTIPEEESDTTHEPEFQELTLSPCSPNSRLHPVPATPTDNALASLEQVDKHVAEALRPLHQQMQHLRREMERLRLQVTENETLKTKVESLTSEVKDLKLKAKNAEAEVEFMRQSMSPQAFALATPLPGAMKVTENFSAPDDIAIRDSRSTRAQRRNRVSNATQRSIQAEAAIARDEPFERSPSILGKRNRETAVSGSGGEVREDGSWDSDPTILIARQSGKRQKLGRQATEMGVRGRERSLLLEEESPMADDGREGNSTPRRGNFTVFRESSPTPTPSNPSHVNRPAPIERPPSLDTPLSAQTTTRHPTSSANAMENQPQSQANSFSFAFVPHPGTPLYPLAMPRSSFPFPEQPTSPTPSGVGSRGGVDLFGFGFIGRPSSRARGRSATAGSSSIGPSAPPEGEVDHGAPGVGLRSSATDLEGVNATPRVKKTMYGTELDSDTRFGDFGREGVASGFWAGGRF